MTYIGIRDMEEKLYTCTEVYYCSYVLVRGGVFFGQVGLNLENSRPCWFPKTAPFSDFPFVARRRTRWL